MCCKISDVILLPYMCGGAAGRIIGTIPTSFIFYITLDLYISHLSKYNKQLLIEK